MTPSVESKKRPVPSDFTVSVSPVRHRSTQSQLDVFQSVLFSATCSLKGPGPPVLACDPRNVIQHLEQRLKPDPSLATSFLGCFQLFINVESNLRRTLLPMSTAGRNGTMRSCDSLARVLLSVGPIQSAVAASLLEKLPEYVGELENDNLGPLPPLMESIPRLILSQFRWLEFLVDSRTLTEKLLEVLSICPLGLKKEIISFLPEVIVDADHEMVVQSLEQMLQDDLQLIVPVLDAFSSFNLDQTLFEQVIALALSSLRSADAEDLPLVVKFLLQSATATNVKQVVHELRENLHFVSVTDVRMSKPDRKLKGKSTATNCEALVLEAIRSGLRFQNLILEAFLKEIRGIEGEENHKVVDVWLLLIIHANGGPQRKLADLLLIRKIVCGDISKSLLRQCIQNRGDSLQEYFQTLICISESCLRSKELVARQFGIHAYELLFEEFREPYYRQEVLGALITHTGSGISHEIGAALETLLLFATKYSGELLPISSFINGVLDYLEAFKDSHLHQVYKIFSQLAVTVWSSGGSSSGSTIANELLIIIRKQISNPDPKYRRMGIIGAVGLASCLGCEGTSACDTEQHNFQGSSTEEAISLLQLILEACKSSALSRGFFYDELTAQVEISSLTAPILEWISKHTCEFETLFLGDLDGGQLQTVPDQCGTLEGEIWMNLDGDVSPIILNVLPMLMAHDQSVSQSLLFLPANFRILAAVERVTNQGSLGSIDALLGCPMYLPKHQLLTGESWTKLSKHQQELGCLALFYAINWIRELINTFSTQIEGKMDDLLTQTTREETIAKLSKRLRNLMYLEYCLAECLQFTKISFPPLHSMVDGPSQLTPELNLATGKQDLKKSRPVKKKKTAYKKGSRMADANGTQNGGDNNSQEAPATGGSRQPTIRDAFNKASGIAREEGHTPAASQGGIASQAGTDPTQISKDIESSGEGLDEQRWKFRPLNISSLAMLSTMQVVPESCCLDPTAQLPMHLYILQDLLLKLDACMEGPVRNLAPWMQSAVRPKASSGLGAMQGTTVLQKLASLFPSLRKHLDCSIAVLLSDVDPSEQECEKSACDEHWKKESEAAGNPHDENFLVPVKVAAQSLFLVMIRCLSKVLGYPELATLKNLQLLKDFLLAFGTLETTPSELLPSHAPNSLEQAFCKAYTYLDSLSKAAATTSFTIATELMMVLKALVDCAQACNEKSKDDLRRRRSNSGRSVTILPYLRTQLSVSAGKALGCDWDADDWKSKGDMMQQLLRMYIENNECSIGLLEELVCTVMPQVPSKGGKFGGAVPGYPALSSATFIIWYRVTHEEVLNILKRVTKDLQDHSKQRTHAQNDVVVSLLAQIHQCIKVHVALVNLTKTHDKAPVHAMAVKSGGKFVDIFLRGVDFLKVHYEDHKKSINNLVKDLQKATRIIQTLCSEAKGQKRMPVTCKVPVVKRSMERFLFCIKALLHGTSHGKSFWMGNLKHRDLQGHEISSQLYTDDQEEELEEEEAEAEAEAEAEPDNDEDTIRV